MCRITADTTVEDRYLRTLAKEINLSEREADIVHIT